MLVAAAARAARVVRTPLLPLPPPNMGEDVGSVDVDTAAGAAGVVSPKTDEGAN